MPRLGLAVLIAALLAGCGGDDGGATDDGGARALLERAQETMRKVESLHFAGDNVTPDGREVITGDLSADGRTRFTVTKDGGRAEAVIIAEKGYLRGDRAYWEQIGAKGRSITLLAGRWVEAPKGSGLEDLGALASPENLAYCLGVDLGTLTSKGTAELDGAPVDVIAVAGDKPGSAPGELSIAAKGPPYVLRALQTGPYREGGGRRDPRCDADNEPDDSTHSDIRLSRFDEPLKITRPANALDLEELVPLLRNDESAA
jgi:hypothetical protein